MTAIAYRPLTKSEYEEVKAEVGKVVAGYTFAYNHNNGIRITPSKKLAYRVRRDEAVKILEVLDRLGMFTRYIWHEVRVMQGAEYLSCQTFNTVYKLA